MPSFTQLAQQLSLPANRLLLSGMLRGIEKEGLRSTLQGQLAQSPHPLALGSALTHSLITTDYSEALLEFITPPCHSLPVLTDWLRDLHAFTQQRLSAEELLWCNSMPCQLPEDQQIPLAYYGTSNRGRMKTIYRDGLGHRYGRRMQTVAGIHYNVSFPAAFWAWLQLAEGSTEPLQDYVSRRYFDLIRNFRRHYWLLIYLFGATPTLDDSFVGQRGHQLARLGKRTLLGQSATALRMGDLGYQSQAQEALQVCYNDSRTYVSSLVSAIAKPYPAYEQLGLYHSSGELKQLNTGLLQIENEFYSAIRPKRTAKAAETALTALCRRGVEYIEVRCLDINPFLPEGLSAEQIQFIDGFLLHCLLSGSSPCADEEYRTILRNQAAVVSAGRDHKTRIESVNGSQPLADAARQLMDAIGPCCELLDQASGEPDGPFTASWQQQMAKVQTPDLTPSAQVLAAVSAQGGDFLDWALGLSLEHQAKHRQHPIDPERLAYLNQLQQESLAAQAAEEARDQGSDFAEYLKRYYAQYPACCSGHV